MGWQGLKCSKESPEPGGWGGLGLLRCLFEEMLGGVNEKMAGEDDEEAGEGKEGELGKS